MKNIIVKQNQELTLPILWTGAEKNVFYNITLAERGAKLTLLGLLLGKNSQSINIKINLFHAAPETKSEVVLKGALSDMSKVNFEGLVKIEKGAKGSNTYLAAHLLLLSNQAKGRAIPSLEILENDIKAGHATTVGKISEMELFYLQSRGLSKRQARSLIVEGFLKSQIERFPETFATKAENALRRFEC